MDHVPVRMTAGLLDPLPISEGSPSELDRTVILSKIKISRAVYLVGCVWLGFRNRSFQRCSGESPCGVERRQRRFFRRDDKW